VNTHQQAGMTAAAAMIVAVNGEDFGRMWELIDEASTAGHARETMAALAGLAGGYVNVVADLQHQPPSRVLDRMAGLIAYEVSSDE
jgi:hypothetical protein